MRDWHVSWKEIDGEWTSEQFNMLMQRLIERYEREAAAMERVTAESHRGSRGNSRAGWESFEESFARAKRMGQVEKIYGH